MLRIGENDYRLVGLDTNALSAVAMDRGNCRRGYFSHFSSYATCFSPYSVLELRQHSAAYEAFLELFDVVPCAMLKNEEMLFNDERNVYPTASGIDPLLLGFSLLNRERGTNLRSVLDAGMVLPETAQREAEWPELKRELLAEWLDLKPNFQPKGDTFKPGDGCRFVDEAALQHIAYRAPKWIRRRAKKSLPIDSHAFPSIRMTLWTIYFRLYWAHRRKGEVQDVFDALISTPAPYLDAIVTENFQAQIYRDVSSLEPGLLNLEVYTLSDLERFGGHA